MNITNVFRHKQDLLSITIHHGHPTPGAFSHGTHLVAFEYLRRRFLPHRRKLLVVEEQVTSQLYEDTGLI